MLLGSCFVSESVFMRMLCNHVHIVLSGRAMLDKRLVSCSKEHWLEGSWQNTSAQAEAVLATSVEQVIVGVARQQPAALRPERCRKNEEQPLVESACPRGQLNIWCCCLSDSPLSPFSTLYLSYSLTHSLCRPSSLFQVLLLMVISNSLYFPCVYSN